MFNWLRNLFMSSTADTALEAAIYSIGTASSYGMHQMKAPKELENFKKSK